jgi:tRNA(Ile)-lysidine synthase
MSSKGRPIGSPLHYFCAMKITKNLLDKMNALNRRRSLVKRGDRILLALSGGADSTALAHLLVLWRKKYGLKLAAAHLHHGLSAQNDLALSAARKTAHTLAIPFFTRKEKVRILAKKKKMTLEEAGREARYAFFASLAPKLRFNKIATAHTLDDQAETVMMRVVRGCGLHGLAGIPAKRPHGKLTVVRPLLDCRKEELLEFLRANKLRFRSDRSNKSPRFTRNRVRNELLPWIAENMNPRIHPTLAGLAERARVDSLRHNRYNHRTS